MDGNEIQRGAYNQTPKKAERQQAQQFDPNAFMQMITMLSQGTQQNIQAVKQPVGQIAESPKNRPRYDIMNDPNYKSGINPQYGRIGEDKLVQSNAAQPMQQQTSQTQPRIMDVVGNALRGLLGGQGQQQQQQGPRINSLTGLPFGTMPGDPAYQDQLVQDAPRAIPVEQPMSQTGQDALSALKQLLSGNTLGNIQDANNIAGTWGQPTQPTSNQPPPKELDTPAGFNQPVRPVQPVPGMIFNMDKTGSTFGNTFGTQRTKGVGDLRQQDEQRINQAMAEFKAKQLATKPQGYNRGNPRTR